MQVRLALRKIIFDFYWALKVRATIKSAEMTEKTIEKLRKSGKGLNDVLNKDKKMGKLIDESVADLIHVETEEEKKVKEKRVRENEKERKKREKAEKKGK